MANQQRKNHGETGARTDLNNQLDGEQSDHREGHGAR